MPQPDFFTMMAVEDYGRLATLIAQRVKPSNEMSALEWSEFLVLEATLKLEGLKAEVIMKRIENVQAA